LLTDWRDRGDLFGMIVGDLGYGNSADVSNVQSGPLAVPNAPPIFYSMGNHELDGIGKRPWIDGLYSGAVRPGSWSTPAGVAPGNADLAYYSFDVGPSTHFVVLDGDFQALEGPDIRTYQGFGAAQLQWFKADLQANTTKNVLVFVHEPLDQEPNGIWPFYTLNDKGFVLDLLANHPRQAYVFSGHLHSFQGITRWKGVTLVHAMVGGGGAPYGVRVTVSGTTITLTNQPGTAVTQMDQAPMYASGPYQTEVVGTQTILHVAEEGTYCGFTTEKVMTAVGAAAGVTPTLGTQMLKATGITWYDNRFISEQLVKIVPGMRFSYDIYLSGVVSNQDAVTVQPNWEMIDDSLPAPITDQNGIALSQRTNVGRFFLYNEDVPSLGGRATGRWYHRDFDLTPLAGNFADGVYLAAAAGGVNVATAYVDNIRFTWPTGSR
jgi:hypothetical protein